MMLCKRLLSMERIKQIVTEIIDSSKNLYDRQDVCKMIILALLADESIFLYGPPGTAKSMLAKWTASILNTDKYFSCLLNQYTQPDELFGPVSIKALEEGRRELLTEGYMPEAEITFLDEIWKAGPAILNTLLTICNEKTFRNGNSVMKVPLKLLISASNEFPEEESGLGALYDRFLIRLEVNPISNKKDFHKLINDFSNNELPEIEALSNEELNTWKEKTKSVLLPEGIFNFIYMLRNELKKNEIYISDRRWKKIVKLMKCCAFLNGRNEINVSDLFILDFTLWSKLQDKKTIEECIKTVFCDYGINIKEKDFVKDIENKFIKKKEAIEGADSELYDGDFKQRLEDLQKEIDALPKAAKEYSRKKFENLLKPKKSYIEQAANIEINNQVSDYIAEKKKCLPNLIKNTSKGADLSNEPECHFSDYYNTVNNAGEVQNEIVMINTGLFKRYITLNEYCMKLSELKHNLFDFFNLKGKTIDGFYSLSARHFIKCNDKFYSLSVPARIDDYCKAINYLHKNNNEELKLRFLDYLLFCNSNSPSTFILDMRFILFEDEYSEWKEYLDSIDFWKCAYGKHSK